jgi:hypothetical protein
MALVALIARSLFVLAAMLPSTPVVWAASQGSPGPSGSSGSFTILFGGGNRSVQVLDLKDAVLDGRSGALAQSSPKPGAKGARDSFCIVDRQKRDIRVMVSGKKKLARDLWAAVALDGSGRELPYMLTVRSPRGFLITNDLDTVGFISSGDYHAASPNECGRGNAEKFIYLPDGGGPPRDGVTYHDEVTISLYPI